MALVLILVVLNETDIIECGSLACEETLNYTVLMVMELLTICLIPVSLKLFSIKSVKARLTDGSYTKRLFLSSLRIAMLGLPMLLNTVFYYAFMSVAFGYMSIICLICLAFVYPGKDRCANDFGEEQ